MEEPAEEKDDKKKGEADASTTKERRSADEIREVVERLSAGCSARPREPTKSTRKRGSKQDLDPAAAAPGTADEEGADGEAKVEDNKAMSEEPRGKQPRPEVQVGDVIKVQTNLGW